MAWIDKDYIVPDYIRRDAWKAITEDSAIPIPDAEITAIIAKNQSLIESYLEQADVDIPLPDDDVPEFLKDALAWLSLWSVYARTDHIPQPIQQLWNSIRGENGLLERIARKEIPIVGQVTQSIMGSFMLANRRPEDQHVSLENMDRDFPYRGFKGQF